MTPARSPQSRRISSLLGQRRVSDVVMVVIMSDALLFGLVGFAVHALWLATVIVLAVGLGYVVANARVRIAERPLTGVGRTTNGPSDSDSGPSVVGTWTISPLGLDGPDRRRTLAGSRLMSSPELACRSGCSVVLLLQVGLPWGGAVAQRYNDEATTP